MANSSETHASDHRSHRAATVFALHGTKPVAPVRAAPVAALRPQPASLPALADYVDLFEQAPVGYVLLDATGCVERINRTGATMLGWGAGELVGTPFSRLVVNGDRPLFYAHQQALHECDGGASQELRVRSRHGRVIKLRLQSLCEPGRRGRAPRYRCALVDLSGQEQSARAQRRLQAQLNEVARAAAVGAVADGVARQMEQPVRSMVRDCEAALGLAEHCEADADELAAALRQARQAASRASEALNHLRRLQRQERPTRQLCRLRGLIQDVSTLISAEAGDDGVELRVNIERHLPPVRVDALQIAQVLRSLAQNSIEAMRREGSPTRQVIVSARLETPGSILVSVSDTGPGLEPGQAARAFEAFHATKTDGMGLGLPVARSIIEAHGGRLWVANTFGDGATLHFTLPTAAGAAPHAA
ncbi:MAG TPA: ATP-binding protein [Rhodanobacteraceae bacterium]|nr:ATP-binding protein [Rhodanobacteraceae bacterium]